MPIRFKATGLLSLMFALVFPGLIALGFWQLDRAAQKEAMSSQFEQRSGAPALDLAVALGQGADAGQLRWRRVRAEGRWSPGPTVLLDNQVHGGRAGYHVLTPFSLSDRPYTLLVNRGWVPAGPDRRQPPQLTEPVGPASLEGVLAPPPQGGVRLAEERAEPLGPNLFRVPRLELAPAPPAPSLALLLYLDPGVPEGFLRQWRAPGVGRERHLAYAFQWFSLAAALLVIYVALGLREGRRLP